MSRSGQSQKSDLLSQDSYRSLRLVQVRTVTGVRHVQVRTDTGFFEGGCRIRTSFRPLLTSFDIIGWTSRDRAISMDPPSTEPVLTAWLQDQAEFVPPGGPSRVQDLLHAGRHSGQTNYQFDLSEVMAMISADTVTCELAYSCSYCLYTDSYLLSVPLYLCHCLCLCLSVSLLVYVSVCLYHLSVSVCLSLLALRWPRAVDRTLKSSVCLSVCLSLVVSHP